MDTHIQSAIQQIMDHKQQNNTSFGTLCDDKKYLADTVLSAKGTQMKRMIMNSDLHSKGAFDNPALHPKRLSVEIIDSSSTPRQSPLVPYLV